MTDGDVIVALAAKCDAQATVIERVQALMAHTPGFHRDYLIHEALAAAPEHTTSDEQVRVRNSNLRALLDAANARVAELGARECLLTEALNQRDRANARADAAERKVLEAARKFLESWEDHEAYPDPEELPEEHALCNAAKDLRAAWVDAEIDAELARRGLKS